MFTKPPIDNNPALFQIIAWHRPGDRPLAELILAQCMDLFTFVQNWLSIQPVQAETKMNTKAPQH